MLVYTFRRKIGYSDRLPSTRAERSINQNAHERKQRQHVSHHYIGDGEWGSSYERKPEKIKWEHREGTDVER